MLKKDGPDAPGGRLKCSRRTPQMLQEDGGTSEIWLSLQTGLDLGKWSRL